MGVGLTLRLWLQQPAGAGVIWIAIPFETAPGSVRISQMSPYAHASTFAGENWAFPLSRGGPSVLRRFTFLGRLSNANSKHPE